MILGPDTIEAEASRIAGDPDELRRFLEVHRAVLLLTDEPVAPRDPAGRVLFLGDAA